jgi:peptidyl-prolyl isomerase E (cyclophilin E)
VELKTNNNKKLCLESRMMNASSTETTTTTDLSSLVDPNVISSKRVVFIGGLANEATVQLVRAAMIPFGPIRSVDVPMDYVKGYHRGFAFVEYDDPDDAEEAIFNMDGAELLNRTIQVSIAQANQIHKLSGTTTSSTVSGGGGSGRGRGPSTEAVWTSDEWFQQYSGTMKDNESIKKQNETDADVAALKS